MKIYFFLFLIFSSFGLIGINQVVETAEARIQTQEEKLCSMYPPKTFTFC